MYRSILSACCAVVLLGTWGARCGGAQETVAEFPRMVWHDEVRFVTSPAHIAKKDWRWLVPVAGATAFLLSTDERNMDERIHTDPTARDRSLSISNYSLGGLAAIPALIAWNGWRQRDPYDEDTGWLAARAVTDALVSSEAISLITRRARPNASGEANFFSGGPGNSAFPSMHAAAAWALVPVVTRRHSSWLTDVMMYGLASGVSVSRVIGREHSPSDVFVGSALGYLVGRYVAASDTRRPPWYWMRPAPRTVTAAKEPRVTGHSPSEYVPMDSWIYPALDRLAALGYVPSQISGMRPWNRSECRRQVREAESLLPEGARTARESEALDLITALRLEFATDSDGTAIVLESVYARNGVIAGPVLNNSFHLGQTWIDDYGRPFGRGWNSNDGFTVNARSGRFFVYVDGEMQHAPGSPPLSPAVRETFSVLDQIPVQPAQPSADTNRFRTIEAYAGVHLGDLEVSVGKQDLWWGPTYDAPLSFSDNAEPSKNLKISTAHPVHLGKLGDVRAEFVIGKLGGQIYTWRPWFNALKISFKLTKDLEMGFTRWSILWGVGHPITVGSLITNLTSLNSPMGSSQGYINVKDPGDRKGGFDFRYRVPGLANWLTLYADSYSDDDPSPLANPRRVPIDPGIYLSHVPGIPKLDFRLEAPSTTPMDEAWDHGGEQNYFNNQYRSGNTNYGVLLGSWVGRDARAQEGWLGYSFSPHTRLEWNVRHLKGSAQFLPGGATQNDFGLKASHQFSREWSASLFVQYENYFIPLLGPRNRNFSSWLQLTWAPNGVLLGKGTQ